MYLGGSLESKDWQQDVLSAEDCAGPRSGAGELVACNWNFLKSPKFPYLKESHQR